jgi:MATE family multidrug resistance protein
MHFYQLLYALLRVGAVIMNEVNYAIDQSSLRIFKELIKNAGPYTFMSFINYGGNFLGVVFVSHLGPNVLAACNVTSAVQNWFNSSIGAAVLSGANSVGQIKGAIDNDLKEQRHEAAVEKYPLIGRSLHDCWAFSLIMTVPVIGFMAVSKPILQLLHQNPQVVKLSEQYFHSYLWGLPAMYMMSCNRKFTLAIGSPMVGLCFTVFYQAADTALSYVLINGKCGLPKLGFVGISYSNTITAWATFVLYTGYMACVPQFKQYGILQIHFDNFWPRVWQQAKLGLPMGIKVCAELGALLGASLMIGAMGIDQQAAQEISYQYVFVYSTLMFGLMDTVVAQVPRAVRARNLKNAKKIGNIGMGVAVAIASVGVIIFASMPELLLKVFINTDDPNNQTIVQTASDLMLLNSVTQIYDSIRNISLAGLNGFSDKDRVMSTLYLIFTALLMYLPLSYLFGFTLGKEAIGVMVAREFSIIAGAYPLLYWWHSKNELPSNDQLVPTAQPAPLLADIEQEDKSLRNPPRKLVSLWASFFYKKSDGRFEDQPIVQPKTRQTSSWCSVV